MSLFHRFPILFFGVLLFTGCGKSAMAPVSQLEVAAVGLYAGALNGDGSLVIVGSINHGVSLWDSVAQAQKYQWSHQAKTDTTLFTADFSPDGHWAATTDAHTIALWDLTTGESPRYWTAPGEILAIGLARDGAAALLGLSDYTAVLFDIKRGGILRTLNHNNRVRSVALSDDNRIALTGSEDDAAIAWDLKTGKPLTKVEHEDAVQLVALSRDGTLAFSMGQYDKAVIWNTGTGEMLGQLPLHAERLKRGLRFTAARFSDDKTLLLTGQPDQRVTLWKLPELAAIAIWDIPKRKAWKPTGAAIIDVAFSGDHTIKVLASNGFVATLQYP